MASASQIATVRANTNESTDANGYTDVVLGGLVDANGGSVNLASAVVWRRKAAKYADLVNVSEAGASRQMSDLFKHAQEMAAFYEGLGNETLDPTSPLGRAKVHVITRID